MTAPVTTYPTMLPVPFTAPPVNPSPTGLYQVTSWTEVGPGQPSRFLLGVEVRGINFGGGSAFGVWESDWCSVPPLDGERKEGTRPDWLDPFEPMTVWAYDQCDLTAPSRREVERRAAQILRLHEQVAVERELADRLLTDAGTPENVDSFTLAISHLEAEFAKTNTTGFIHVGAQWVAQMATSQLLTKAGTKLLTPLGHTLVFGGGYVAGLEDTLVATSQPFGWRDETVLRTAIDERRNTFAAIAERTIAIGYEAAVGAATITP